MVSLVVIVLSTIVTLLISSLLVRLAARWVKSPKPTFRNASCVTIVIWIYAATGSCMQLWTLATLPPNEQLLGTLFSALILLGVVFLSLLFVKHVFSITLVRGLTVVLAYIVGSMVGICSYYFILNPYVVESFSITSNSMAPTLVGWHRTGICPQCAQPVMIPAPDVGLHDVPGICSRCMSVSKVDSTKIFTDRREPDRIFVNKLGKPNRWDLVVFRSPKDPASELVLRVVAFQGEQVVIKDGFIWVNGAKQTPPASIAQVRYTTQVGSGFPVWHGSERKPMHLENGECCLLGDFSINAFDSRMFGPVPLDNIEGVVDLRYWPLSRFRLFR